MKRLLLAGGGPTHALVLRELARRRNNGVDIVVVTPSSQLRYTAKQTVWIARHYAQEELTVELTPLAQAAGARLIAAHVQRLDLANRVAFTNKGEAFDFDVLSIATGAVVDLDAIGGAREFTLP